jgi:hypothetical protein
MNAADDDAREGAPTVASKTKADVSEPRSGKCKAGRTEDELSDCANES